MWVTANVRFNSGWVYYKRNDSLDVYGDVTHTMTGYTGLKMNFQPVDNMLKRDRDGNITKCNGIMMIPASEVSGIEPKIQNTFLEHEYYGTFRCVAIDDFSRQKFFEVYYLYMIGDELAERNH